MNEINPIVIANNIEKLSAERGITKTKALIDSGVGKDFIVNMINKKQIPSFVKVFQIADYFGVSIDYESIEDYKIDDNYKYEINFASPKYCLKASKLKDENDNLDVYLDLIDYNSLSCNSDVLNYSDDVVAMKAVLSVDKSNNIYFINSFMIID